MFQNSIVDKLEKSPTADDMQFGEQGGLDEQFFRKNYSTISQTQQNVIHLSQATKRSPNHGVAGIYIQESTASKTKMSSTVSKSLLN